ncbi:proprotein convertase subtilisin/kexin type 7-like [Pecten maximus]|uniref:proprotein convertase subtilisin/kexin type 7-like n=1 Tax=Pecten maximus TaxID=6579 RepID=UPI00145875B3|nr:proprotein convertase subtilisin/kexin type 7-like [Pecten maximus]XP_033759158.1 proprotein convertase subtilisin/kexin type 7-like [Pecten maximus]
MHIQFSRHGRNRPFILRWILVVAFIIDISHSLESKQIPFPIHIENFEDTLIWAVKIGDPSFNKYGLPDFEEDKILQQEEDLKHIAHSVASDLDVHSLGRVGEIPNIFLFGFYFPDGSDKSVESWKFVDLHNHHKNILNDELIKKAQADLEKKFDGHENIVWYSRQKIVSRQKRKVKFKDPKYKEQWHLVNHVYQAMDINVTGVWNRNVTGKGVTVAVVDDGLEWTNPDLQDNYNAAGSWDLNSDDSDPMPNSRLESNHHGTRCAGEIAAVRNSICGVGVAYDAKVSGLRVLDGPMTDSLEASAFNKNMQINDVYSCSWGPDDDGKTVDGPHLLAQAAMRYGINYGRGGYGNIYVVASGNGGRFQDNCNYDGYANSLYTVTIGAVDETGHMPFYAEECASMLAVTFSSGSSFSQRSIVTTDWTKHGGNGCTSRHTGTSAAAPLAAGMIALMLQVRPCLTWRDIQYIIAMTAQKVDVNLADWQRNGAGLFHSHKHGFGLMKAWRLVNAAKIWTMVSWLTAYSHESGKIRKEIPKSMSSPLIVFYNVTEGDIGGFDLLTLEHVQVTLSLEHPYRGYLEIQLACPSGTKSVIGAPRRLDNSTKGFSGWTFSTVRCWGEKPVGTWKLTVIDTDPGDHGKGYLTEWKLKLYGSPMTQEEFQERKKAVHKAMSGEYLNDTYSLPCGEPPVKARPDAPMSEKTLKILALVSAFCLVMAIYESMEYALCYKEEKQEQLRRKNLKKDANRLANRHRIGDHDSSETRALLQEEEEIPLDIISSNQNNSSTSSIHNNSNPSLDTSWNSFSESDLQRMPDLGDEEEEVVYSQQRTDMGILGERQVRNTRVYASMTNQSAAILTNHNTESRHNR